MLSTAAQAGHFAVPSSATTVSLDRPQFLHFQLFKACSMDVPAFFADTGDGHALAWRMGSVGGSQISRVSPKRGPAFPGAIARGL